MPETIKIAAARKYVAGTWIWQFADARAQMTYGAMGRPREYNNKGIIDEHRRPKLAYYAVKALYTKLQHT